MIDIRENFNQIISACDRTPNNCLLFSFSYEKLFVSCIFASKPKILIVAIPSNNCGWNTDVSDGFISEKIPNEAYKIISKSLKSKSGKYSNKNFFKELANQLISQIDKELTIASENSIQDMLQYTKTNDKNYDTWGDKPFFDHWRRVKPSSKSLDKIQRLFGRDVREACWKAKVTGVWFDIPRKNSTVFIDPNRAIQLMPNA